MCIINASTIRTNIFPNNDHGFLNFKQGYCKVLKSNDFPDAECEGPPKGCGGGSQCSANAECKDNNDSGNQDQLYDCVCNKGYKGDGRVCLRGKQDTFSCFAPH